MRLNIYATSRGRTFPEQASQLFEKATAFSLEYRYGVAIAYARPRANTWGIQKDLSRQRGIEKSEGGLRNPVACALPNRFDAAKRRRRGEIDRSRQSLVLTDVHSQSCLSLRVIARP